MMDLRLAQNYATASTFDGSGNATVHAGNGSAVIFTLVGSSYIAASHVLASLVKSGSNYVLTDKAHTQITFNSAGSLIQQVDRNNYATNFTYAGTQLTTVSAPGGRSVTFAYYPSGLVQTVSDSAGRSVGFQYDGSSNLTQLTDMGGNNTQFTYDPSSHLMLTMKSPNCVATSGCNGVTNVYDGQGRVTQQTDAMGRVWKFSYSQTGPFLDTTITDPRGDVTVDSYANNVLMSETKGQGTGQQATWTYQYDSVSLGKTTVIDPNGHSSSTTRDSQANVLSSTDTLGRTSRYTYNSFNEPLTVQDPLQVTTTNAYDPNGNLQQVSRPLNGQVKVLAHYAYGDAYAGDVTQIQDANLKLWNQSYDVAGTLQSRTDPLGHIATYGYNAAGQMTSSVSPRGNVNGGQPSAYTTTIVPNAFGQPLSVTNPLQQTTTYQYDPDQNHVRTTDANSHVSQYTYDLADEPTGVVRPDKTSATSSYDGNGNLVVQTDGLQNATTYRYDALDRKASTSDPLHRTTTYGYDLAGNLTSMTDPQGQMTSYAYDGANELVAITYSDPRTHNVTISYDADGQRVGMGDGTGSSTYVYDSLHRLTQAQQGAGQTVGYGYDLKGELTSITYPGQSTPVRYAYDDAGRLQSVSDWATNTTSFGHDENSNMTSVTYPNTVGATLTYDAADRLSARADVGSKGQVDSFNYGRDLAGQLNRESSNSYGYDANDRITRVTSTSDVYAYDAADRVTTTPAATALTYDPAGELQSLTTASGQRANGYDPRGNRTTTTLSGTTTTMTYDQANRLIAYGSTASYGYNGEGIRTSKTVSGTTTQQVWDIHGGLPTLLQDGGNSYINGPSGLPIEQISATGQINYFHQDQVGSTRALTDASGYAVANYSFDAFGNLTSQTGTASTAMLYAGQYADTESGFYYLRARYYDPATGQFISRDPAVAMTRQPYSYSFDNPLNMTDPTGLFGWGDVQNFVIGAAHISHTEAVVGYAASQAAAWVDQEHYGAALVGKHGDDIASVCGGAALVIKPAAGYLAGCGVVAGAASVAYKVSNGDSLGAAWTGTTTAIGGRYWRSAEVGWELFGVDIIGRGCDYLANYKKNHPSQMVDPNAGGMGGAQ